MVLLSTLGEGASHFLRKKESTRINRRFIICEGTGQSIDTTLMIKCKGCDLLRALGKCELQ
jgi:hypothetical protein